jgi:hypothetical protein
VKFTLTITLGNDAMQLPEDVAEALRIVADKLPTSFASKDEGIIRDVNGNNVGDWQVV